MGYPENGRAAGVQDANALAGYPSRRRINNPPLEFVHFWEKVGQTIVFRGLLGWAFRPRNFMKNHARLREIPDGRGGFSTLSCLARHS
ncbi:MAG TPA: hypothetical protein VNY05_00030, partial [Candidatus Acidoferrales bacterium]|nr:hypothetical protein [Candidatus Acidoferrales bacterium]